MDEESSKDLIERLTLGVATTLEKRPGICNVSLSNNPPAERHTLVGWEQRYFCTLPEDLKSFYLTTNGLLLTWCVKETDETEHPVGKMMINCVGDLVKLSASGSVSQTPSLADVDYDSEEEDVTDNKGRSLPHYDGRCKIFELDPCSGFGKVCLVYTLSTSETSIWFLDRSLQWSFLADNFTTYYRLMLMHLGLPHWQYAFTSIGLSPKAKQWFNLYAPIRLQINEELIFENIETDNTTVDVAAQKIDFGKLFRGKSMDKPKGKGGKPQGGAVKKSGNQALSGSKSFAAARPGRNSSKPWT